MKVEQWDVVAYRLGGKICLGVVLQVLDSRCVRVDTDGVIEKSRIVSLEHGKGRDAIYSGREYKEHESYRLWLRDNYGLPIKEV
jgi:hypothetical protein